MRGRLLLGLMLLAMGCGTDSSSLEVRTDTGVVRGVAKGETRAFLGIPYAAPPVGAHRWRPPQRAEAWTGVRDAVSPGSQCPQSFSLGGPGGEEDCLFLNVWTPTATTAPMPVMVWLHGGAFVFGSGGDEYYAGQHLAETSGVVIVTLNYRLGALGFFAHPQLAGEDPAYPSSGNYGLDDQLAALQWVQRNIGAFGGDASRVTLFGESAGGFSTCAHYVSSRAAGLFHTAISQSGLCAGGIAEPTRAEAEANGIALAQTLGCPGTGAAAISCMRDRSTDALLDATATEAPADQTSGGPFYAGGSGLATVPNIDGFVLEKSLRDAFAAGGYEPRPLVLGANRDEGTLFHSSFLSKELADESELRDALTRRFGTKHVDPIIARYPVARFPSANRALAEITGDAFFVCPARRTARGAAAAGALVYLYSFERLPEQAFMPDLGVFHSSEIPFLFGTDPAFPLARVGASGQDIATTMQGYWTRFATTGDPNGADAPSWPRFDAAADQLLAFDAAAELRSGHKSELCDFWDALVVR